MKILPKDGSHHAEISGKVVVYPTDEGALCLAVPVTLVNAEIAWSGKSTHTLVNKEGQLMTKSIDNLRRVFPEWGGDIFGLEDIEVQGRPVEVVGEESEFTNEKGESVTNWKIKWLNPPGGSSRMPEPVADQDRKALIAKFGSKFKAHFGSSGGAKTKPTTGAAGKAAVAATETKAEAPAEKKAAPQRAAASGPPSRSNKTSAMARTSSQEEVWTALQKANDGVDENDLATRFYEAQDAVRAGADSNMTPAEWGQVADHLGL